MLVVKIAAICNELYREIDTLIVLQDYQGLTFTCTHNTVADRESRSTKDWSDWKYFIANTFVN